mmetsp:Transcript_6721/g.16467  ORF Transcript_6721/g.16467 Transcript_6721/m.16467 type:complete len:131 (+) Transcript_6721:193-585(+)|eukprot:g4550.t1
MDFPDLQLQWRLHERSRRRFFNLRRFLVNYAMEGGAVVHQEGTPQGNAVGGAAREAGEGSAGEPVFAGRGRTLAGNDNMDGTSPDQVIPGSPSPGRRRTTVKRRSFSVMEDLARQEEDSLSDAEKKLIII